MLDGGHIPQAANNESDSENDSCDTGTGSRVWGKLGRYGGDPAKDEPRCSHTCTEEQHGTKRIRPRLGKIKRASDGERRKNVHGRNHDECRCELCVPPYHVGAY